MSIQESKAKITRTTVDAEGERLFTFYHVVEGRDPGTEWAEITRYPITAGEAARLRAERVYTTTRARDALINFITHAAERG